MNFDLTAWCDGRAAGVTEKMIGRTTSKDALRVSYPPVTIGFTTLCPPSPSLHSLLPSPLSFPPSPSLPHLSPSPPLSPLLLHSLGVVYPLTLTSVLLRYAGLWKTVTMLGSPLERGGASLAPWIPGLYG